LLYVWTLALQGRCRYPSYVILTLVPISVSVRLNVASEYEKAVWLLLVDINRWSNWLFLTAMLLWWIKRDIWCCVRWEIGGRALVAFVGGAKLIPMHIICLYAAIRGLVSRRTMRLNLWRSDLHSGESISWATGRRAVSVSLVHIPVHILAVVVDVLNQLARTNCSMRCCSSWDVLSRISLVAMAACRTLASMRIDVREGWSHSNMICAWSS